MAPIDDTDDPGDAGGPLETVRRGLAALGCSPAEAVALGLLALAAVAALGLLAVATSGIRAPAGASAMDAGLRAPDEVLQFEPDPPAAVVVHVAGRVAAPGVYRVPGGARVEDALEAAGGALPDAALEALNLARTVADGEQVLVRAVGDPAASSAASDAGAGPPAVRADGRLDLNLATAGDLQQLPGVGPVLAERVIAHRESLGGRFSEVGQLRDVPGIGEAKFQAVAELVDV